MKIGHLKECNMRNIFLEKSCTKCDWETSPRLLSKNLKFNISLDNSLKCYTVYFYCMASWRLSKYIETKLQTSWFHLILSFFIKWKEVWNQYPYLIFHIIFEENYFSCYILLIDQISLPGCLYFVRYWTICVLQLFANQVVTSWILKLNLSF